jgi:hypothetical protein
MISDSSHTEEPGRENFFWPSRDVLIALREKVLSPLPRDQVDRAILETLPRDGPFCFLEVSTSLIYRADGEQYYRKDRFVTLRARQDSIGVILPSGEIEYWAGKPPDFWDGWMSVPRYTTDCQEALNLKFHVLGLGKTVVIEEVATETLEDDGETYFRSAFRAEFRDAAGATVAGPVADSAATAVILAMFDYMLAPSALTTPPASPNP